MDLLHVFLAADDERGAFVEGGGLLFEDADIAIGGESAGLLGDHGERVGFVHEAEFAVGVFHGGRIEEDAAFQEDAVEVGDERADPGGSEECRDSRSACA